MPRVDIYDLAPEPEGQLEPLWCGFTRAKLDDKYTLGKPLGQGGFGSVRVCCDKATGKEWAVKSIEKRLTVPNISPAKQQQHLENIKREALILRKLRGTLNVVYLEDVLEDEDSVHLVMEHCKGGELVHRINTRHYSERTAASYMRAVLRTLAQCHHLRILHRDIKPGNFMLLTDAERAPVKAIDFGLAVFFDPKALPRKDLGLEGTPHFMAPEQLSGRTEPASDIWSAGIMAYQLLCGSVPFDDAKNPKAPALSLVWRAILTEEPKFTSRNWANISEQAKDFVRFLLKKDPKDRPSAKQALAHPWLQGKSDQRGQGLPLNRTVVQRLQKFGVESALKRTVLDMIANDLINRHMEQLSHAPHQPPTAAGAAAQEPAAAATAAAAAAAGTAAGPDVAEATPQGAAAAISTPGGKLVPPAAADVAGSLRQLAAQDLLFRAAHKCATVHGGGGDALALLRRSQKQPSVHGGAAAAGSLAAAAAAAAQVTAAQRRSGEYLRQSSSNLPSKSKPMGLGPHGPGFGPGLGLNSPALPLPLPPPGIIPQSPSLNRRPTGPHPPGLLASSFGPGVPPLTVGSPGAVAGSSGTLGPLGAAAAAAASAASGSYKGPVKDMAAATAWDMSFMANRLAAEGSGHALQHYAWLLHAGERSFHGVLERSYHAGRAHTPAAEAVLAATASLPLGVSPAAAAAGSPASAFASAAGAAPFPRRSGSGSAAAAPGAAAAIPTPAAAASTTAAAASGGAAGPHSLPNDAEYVRVLSLVAKQRAEHRKVQRLSLDTSGHRQTGYASLVAGAVAGQNDAGWQPPQEADEDQEVEGSGDSGGLEGLPPGLSAAPSTSTTLSLNAPSGLSSLYVSAAFPPPSPNSAAAARSLTGPLASGALAADLPGAAAAGPIAAAVAAADVTPPTPVRPQPSIRGLAEADALGFVDPAVAAARTAAANAAAAEAAAASIAAAAAAAAAATAAAAAAAAAAPVAPLAPPPAAATVRPPSDGTLSVASSAGGPAAAAVAADADGESEAMDAVAEDEEADGERGSPKRSSLLKKVRKALMKPVKSLLTHQPSGGPPAASGASQSGAATPAAAAATSTAGGMGALFRNSMGMGPPRNSTTGANGAATPGGLSAALARASRGPAAVLQKDDADLRRGSRPGTGAITPGASAFPGLDAAEYIETVGASEERGRGRGAYALLMQGNTGTNTPADRSAHGGNQERSGHGSDRSGHGGDKDRSGHGSRLAGPAGYAIHTVRAHQPSTAAGAGGTATGTAAATPIGQSPAKGEGILAAAVAKATAAQPGKAGAQHVRQLSTTDLDGIELPALIAMLPTPKGAAGPVVDADDLADAQARAAGAAAGPGVEGKPAQAPAGPVEGPAAEAAAGSSAAAGQPAAAAAAGAAGGGAGPSRGSVRQEELAPALALLLGDASKVAELQDVMARLHYDKSDELTFDQLSEGLSWLGYRLEPSEVEELLRQVSVGTGEGLTASQFIASQVDWRSFQANHRAEWMQCLRHAFEELGGGAGGAGAISVEQLEAALNDKLPEEEVNLAVQESLMDAAVEADVVDFDAFVRLMRCNSSDSLGSGASSELSYDLYDPRLKDASLHGPLEGGSHYTPALETVPDKEEGQAD
ncbi:hypothetical protein HYH03_006234 [Edaphochlamys debaryana]|uniref:Protein kinase domain-containing protein n=1 Tax=Edaphochlamys debaryana TaxID=47281 RepID=A0A835YDM5_9CHLO|nr:hypothetical protein HYH03_006234 [Edaphochlamys debaryana]|eukprot:KAG2495634.1 hypothetical protein HYH03_006234 [Edaphochlamys debaryana]